MRKILFSIVLSCVFAFACFAPSVAMANAEKKPAEHGEKQGEKKEDKKEEHKKSGKEGSAVSGGGDTFYVKMDPMIIPVISERGMMETVSMVISIQVKDYAGAETVNQMMPKLMDAYVRALYGRIDKSIYRNGQFLDVGRLKNKLVTVTSGLVEKDMVQDVLIQGVSQRKFN
jgi:hypothetical protein